MLVHCGAEPLALGGSLLCLLRLSLSEAPVQVTGSCQPQADDGQKDETQIGGGCSQGTETDDHKLLDQCTSGFTQGVANHIDGSFTLGLGLFIQRNVCHLLARIEQRVLGGLGEDVLCSTNKYSSKERSQSKGGQAWGESIREEHQGEEDDAGDQQNGRGDQSCHSPSKLGEDPAGDDHHGEGDGTSGSGEVTHEGRVVVRVGELSLDLRFPGNLDQVDGNSIGNDQEGQIPNVRRGCQETEGFSHRHRLLLLFLFALGNGTSNTRDNSLLQIGIDGANEQTANDNHTHETLEGKTPAVNARRQVGTDLREDLHGTARENEGNVGSKSEKRIELLSFINGSNLIGKAPEKNRDHDGTPQLCHDIEEAVGPVANDSNGTCKTRTSGFQKFFAEFGGVEHITHRVEGECKSTEKGNEGDDAGVEKLLGGEHVGELGVENRESNGHGEVDPCLQEWNDFCTRPRGSDDQHILGVTENGVVVKNAEEHETKGNDLFPSEGGDA